MVTISLLLFANFRSREAFNRMCSLIKEPEDVTVGFVVGEFIEPRSAQFMDEIHFHTSLVCFSVYTCMNTCIHVCTCTQYSGILDTFGTE